MINNKITQDNITININSNSQGKIITIINQTYKNTRSRKDQRMKFKTFLILLIYKNMNLKIFTYLLKENLKLLKKVKYKLKSEVMQVKRNTNQLLENHNNSPWKIIIKILIKSIIHNKNKQIIMFIIFMNIKMKINYNKISKANIIKIFIKNFKRMNIIQKQIIRVLCNNKPKMSLKLFRHLKIMKKMK